MSKKITIKIIVLFTIILSTQIYDCMKYKVTATNQEEVKTTINTGTSKKSIKELKIVIPQDPYTYTGKERNASVKIYDGNKQLSKDKDYTLTYKNNIKTGKATVTIQGKGNYIGTVTKNYYIAPAQAKITSVLFNAKGTKATITWNKDSMATGYEIYMSTSKNGEYKKIKTIDKKSITTYVVKNLSSKKTYYFKIRSYKMASGKKVCSKKYSNAKTNTGLLAEITLNSPMSGKDRNYNLKLASAKINGTVLKPGDTFNWFKVVGAASKAKGYRKAGIFVNGKTVKGYGGGVCQVSSTLYQAALKAKLKIVERYTHSQYVPYAETGKDATVAYGSKNLRIKNNKKYSIKIVAYSDKTKTICKLYRVTDK